MVVYFVLVVVRAESREQREIMVTAILGLGEDEPWAL